MRCYLKFIRKLENHKAELGCTCDLYTIQYHLALTKLLASVQTCDFTFLPLTPKTITQNPNPITHPLKAEDVPNSTITLTHPQTLTLTRN